MSYTFETRKTKFAGALKLRPERVFNLYMLYLQNHSGYIYLRKDSIIYQSPLQDSIVRQGNGLSHLQSHMLDLFAHHKDIQHKTTKINGREGRWSP